MRYNHYCKKCGIQFSLVIEREPTTKAEKDYCEEYDSETFLGNPKTKTEETQAEWYYGDDDDNYTEIPANKEELAEYDFCDNCRKFIRRRWTK